MFDALSRFAVRRWPVVVTLTALFCVYGWFSFRALPVEAFPDVTDPMVEVVGLYPGQAAEEVEKRVTVELERVLAGTPHLVDLRSVSVFGLSLITLTFDDDISELELRTRVAQRLTDANLPEGAVSIMGPEATPVGQIYRYTLEGPRSLRELRSIQDFVVERRLASVPGVAEVVTFGGYERQYQVRIDPALLGAYGVSVGEVYDAVASAARNAGGGYVGIGSQEFVVRGLGTPDDPAELGWAVVREVDGVPVRVRDVATIVEGSTPRRGSVGRGRADEVVEGIVLLRRGENPSVVLEALHERIRLLNESILPEDVRINTFYDRNDLVNATLATVGKNMLEGVLLVLFLVYLFLRTLRGTLIIGVVIPVSLLAAFVGLRAMGLPANLISLGAIDFGILVDGAIIVLEATLHELHRPARPGETKAGRIERVLHLVSRPVALAMIIIIAALFPIFTLERTEGRIFAPMAYTYAFALIGALVSAVVIVPALERVLLPDRWTKGEPTWLRWLGDRYAALLRRAIPMRRAALPIALAIALGLGLYGSTIGSEFLPELNEGGFYITAVFPSTVSLETTQAHVSRMREHMLSVPEVSDVLSHIGRPESATQAEGSNNAEFFVQLFPEKHWRPGLDRVALEAELREKLAEIPGVQYNFSQPITDRVFETISGIIGQVVVKVSGEDLERMTDLAEAIRERLSTVEGVTDLSLYQAGDSPQLRVDLDRAALSRRGLSVDDVQRTIEIALGGLTATEVWDGERRYAVALRLPDSVRANPEALARLVVGSAEDQVTLGEVAKIEVARGRQAIWRQDFSRFVAVKFNVRGRDLGSTVEDARAAVADLEVPEGMYLSWGGEFENQARAMARLGLTMPISFAVIIGILYFVFRRSAPVWTTLAFIPVAIAGAIAGLHVLGENFSVSGAVGCIALVGQVALAGVVICTRIDEAAAAGSAEPEVEGARVAFRPVLLAMALAMFGLVPAAMSHAMGSETQRPFAIAIVAGLAVLAPAILLLLPLAYRPPKAKRDEEEKEAPEAKSMVAAGAALLLGVLVALPSSAMAQDEATFTLEEALAEMDRAHPMLRYAEQTERAAEGESVAAGLWENPTFEASWLFGVHQNSYDSFGAPMFGLSQFIELSDRPGARRRAADAELEAVRAETGAVRAQLALEVERTFVELLVAHETEAIVQRSVADLERVVSVVEARVAAGASPPYDHDRLLAALAEARAELALVEGERAAARARFDAAVGPRAATLVGKPVYEGEPRDPGPLEPYLDRARSEQPELRASRARVQALEAEVDLSRREVFPGIGVSVMTGFGQSPGQVDVGVGVSIPLPIFNTGQGSIAAAEARALAAEEKAEGVQIEIEGRVRGAWQRARAAFQAYAAFAREVEGLDTRMLERAEAAYREGRASVLDLIDGLRTVRELEKRRLELSLQAVEADIALRGVLAGRS